jgi:hypothetical protein
MSTVTKNRILHVVPDDTTPAVLTRDIPRGRSAALTTERETAALAITMPEVVDERDAAIDATIQRLAKHTMDRRRALTLFAEEMLILGYMNGAADQRNAPYLKLTEDTLAEVLQFETAERDAARQAEKAIKAKACES